MFKLGAKIDLATYDVMRGKKVCGRIIKRSMGKSKMAGHAFKYGTQFGDGPSLRVAASGSTPKQIVAKLNALIAD